MIDKISTVIFMIGVIIILYTCLVHVYKQNAKVATDYSQIKVIAEQIKIYKAYPDVIDQLSDTIIKQVDLKNLKDVR